MQNAVRVLIALIVLYVVLGCSSAPEHVGSDYVLASMIPKNLRVRRPPFESANPHSNPGGVDYQNSNNVTNSCQKVTELFSIPEFGIHLQELRSCLFTLKDPLVVSYILRREQAPFLILDEESKVTPACLKATLKRIPVPREIVFDSTEFNRKGERDCYTARLDVEANDLLGVKLPTHKVALNVRFPLEHLPQTDDDTLRLLGTWSVALFRDPQSGHWRAQYLPSSLCKQCIEGRAKDPYPLFWP